MHQRLIGKYLLEIYAGPSIGPVAEIETAADLIAPNHEGPDHHSGQSQGREHGTRGCGQFAGNVDARQMLQRILQSLEMKGCH